MGVLDDPARYYAPPRQDWSLDGEGELRLRHEPRRPNIPPGHQRGRPG